MSNVGLVRSSHDSLRASGEVHFTPAVRQFSAPRSINEE